MILTSDVSGEPIEIHVDLGLKGDKGDPGAPGAAGAKGDPGEKGDKGDKGDAGIQGPQGPAGIQGLKGEKGDQGEVGEKGETGEAGPQGPQGAQGIQGVKGDTGPKGDTGAKGDTGDTGPQGLQGVQGPKGDKGDTGATGAQGIAGAKGEKGDKGDRGEKGDQGVTGATGLTGATGPVGPKGDTGAQGPIGLTGAAGPVGEKGDKGDKGDQGIQGVQGPTGPQGLTGAAGAKGDKGDTGAAGPQGIQGVQGPKGDKGDKGDAGATGAAGPKGEAGDTGPQGLQGVQGPKGDPGPQGEEGPIGPEGPKGDDGEKGDTGDPGPYILPESFGAVGDGVTDDTPAITTTMAAKKPVNLDADFSVTSFFNKYGVPMLGPGRIVKPITGGLQQLNSYADNGQHICGQEYMYAIAEKLRTRAGSTSVTILLAGDSTTVGVGTTNDGVGGAATGTLQAYILGLCAMYGIANVNIINDGVSSSATNQWINNKLNSQMGLNPDLMIIRFGINDPTQGRDVDLFLGELDLGLSRIRGTAASNNYNKGVNALSILLMTPNSTSDTPNGRHEMWYESINGGIKSLARKHQCGFIDTYALWQDSRTGAGLWLDNPLTNPAGRGIHPRDTMNAWISSKIFDFVFPAGLISKITYSSPYINPSASRRLVTNQDAPSTFGYGIGTFRMSGGSPAAPLDGQVTVVKQADNIWYQLLTPYATADAHRMPFIRYAKHNTDTWGEWLPLGILSTPGASSKPAASVLPAQFQVGTANYQIQAADGWPFDGFLKVEKNIDGYAVQTIWQNSTTVPGEFNGVVMWRETTDTKAGWKSVWKNLTTVNPIRSSFNLNVARTISDYPLGMSIYDVRTSDGFPINGILTNWRNAAGFNFQILTAYGSATPIMYHRNVYFNGTDTTWTAWSVMGSMKGSATVDPTTISTGLRFFYTNITVPGAIVGKTARIAFSVALPDEVRLDAWVTAADTVRVRFEYLGATSIDLGSGTLFAQVDQ